MCGRKLSSGDVPQPLQFQSNSANRYPKKHTNSQKAPNTRNNSKDYSSARKAKHPLSDSNSSAISTLSDDGEQSQLIGLRYDLVNKKPDLIKLDKYFTLFKPLTIHESYSSYSSSGWNASSSLNAAQNLVVLCTSLDLVHNDPSKSKFSTCCFHNKAENNQKYQTAQMIGLGIRLREML